MVVSVGKVATVMAYKLAHIGQAITNSCHITRIHFRVICSVCVHVCVCVHVVCACIEVEAENGGGEEKGREVKWKRGEEGDKGCSLMLNTVNSKIIAYCTT